MSKKYLKFKTADEDIDNRLFECDSSWTIKQMLEYFLSQTNSKMILDIDKIVFMHSNVIINAPNMLDKKVEKIFNKRNNAPIKVQKDLGNIIGGKLGTRKK